MTDRPIIFSAPMVRALLDGRKTQTRRVLKPQPHERAKGCYHRPDGSWVWVDAPRENNGVGYYGNRLDDRHFFAPYAIYDRLYAREGFAMNAAVRHTDRTKNIIYRADVPAVEPPHRPVLTMDRILWAESELCKWQPSIHMPRWASRLTLIATDVRVQRLQEISEADAVAEGIERLDGSKGPNHFTREITGKWSGSFNAPTAQEVFADLWNDINGPEAWDANPWVVAVSFTVHRCNIDRMEARND